MPGKDFLTMDEVTLRSSQIKSLIDTPIELLPAPTARFSLFFLFSILRFDPGSEVLTESGDNLAIKYTNGAGLQISETIEMTGFIDQSQLTFTNALPTANSIISAANSYGQPIVLHNTGRNFEGNVSDDATLLIRTYYVINNV